MRRVRKLFIQKRKVSDNLKYVLLWASCFYTIIGGNCLLSGWTWNSLALFNQLTQASAICSLLNTSFWKNLVFTCLCLLHVSPHFMLSSTYQLVQAVQTFLRAEPQRHEEIGYTVNSLLPLWPHLTLLEAVCRAAMRRNWFHTDFLITELQSF